jgi:hypothetical protein
LITKHTRTRRLYANAGFIALSVAFAYLIDGSSHMFKLVVATLVLVPGYLMYAYYIASLCCDACGASLIAGNRTANGYLLRLYALFAPLHIPYACRDCGARTDW